VADVAEAVLAGSRSRILLLSDFDGTLCEFRNDPESVHLARSRRAALSTLTRRPGVCIGIVSGRRAAAGEQLGALVAAGDGEALTEAIRRYLGAPEVATEHGRNARAHVERNFSLDNEVRGVNAVYETLWREAERGSR